MSAAPAATGDVRDPWPTSGRDAALRLALLAAYLALIAHAGVQHVMWLDEAQAWLIARDAGGLGELHANLRYEGHPGLWHLLLFVLTRVSDDPNLMLALNFVVMGSAVALALWCLPFRPWERILFPFGYYTLFEYAVKARPYGLGTLLVVLLSIAWPRRAGRPVLVALLLALLANTHAMLFILTLGVAAGLALETLLGRPRAIPLRAPAALAALLLVAGWALALATFIPPADSGIATTWFLGFDAERLRRALGVLGAIVGGSREAWLALPAALILAGVLWTLRRAVAPATFLVITMLGLLAFCYTKYGGSPWISGVAFLAFLAAVWTGRSDSEAAMPGVDRELLTACFTAALAFQLHAGITAYRDALSRPYSNSKAVAGLIAHRGWSGDLIAGLTDQGMPSIIAYLGADRFYFLNGKRWGSFTVWDRKRQKPVDLDRALRKLARSERPVVLVKNRTPLDGAVLAAHGFHEVGRFTGAQYRNEDYFVYRRAPAE